MDAVLDCTNACTIFIEDRGNDAKTEEKCSIEREVLTKQNFEGTYDCRG